MQKKVFKKGGHLAITLPADLLESIGVQAGEKVIVELDRDNHRIIVRPVEDPQETFARQVTEFIGEYRPALEALAKK